MSEDAYITQKLKETVIYNGTPNTGNGDNAGRTYNTKCFPKPKQTADMEPDEYFHEKAVTLINELTVGQFTHLLVTCGFGIEVEVLEAITVTDLGDMLYKSYLRSSFETPEEFIENLLLF